MTTPQILLAADKFPDGSQTIYGDALDSSWRSYSSAQVDFAVAAPVQDGKTAISVLAEPGKDFRLHHTAVPADYESLSFWIHGGPTGGQALKLSAVVREVTQPAIVLKPLRANKWTQVNLTFKELGIVGATHFDGIKIESATNIAVPIYYLDDIHLVGAPAPKTVSLKVDATKILRTVDARLFGVNAAVWDAHLGDASTAPLLSKGGFNIIRYPGGSLADDYDWHTNTGTPPSRPNTYQGHMGVFARLLKTMGAQGCITVNYGSGTPEQAAAWVAYCNGDASNTDALGTDLLDRDWKTVGFWATLRSSEPIDTDDGYNFLRIGHPASLGIIEWQLGNENYGSWERDDHGKPDSKFTGVPHDPLTYAQNFVVFYQKMKAVDPTIHLAAPVQDTPEDSGNKQNGVANPNENGKIFTGWTPVLLHNLKQLGVQPDTVDYHFYPQQPNEENDLDLLTAANSLPLRSARIRKMIVDFYGEGGEKINLANTELNCVSFNPGRQSVSLVNALYLADAIGCLGRSEFLQSFWWDVRNGAVTEKNNIRDTLYGKRNFGDYGLFATGQRDDTPLDTPYPAYYAYRLLTHWAAGGDNYVTTSSNYKMISVYSALRKDGTLSLLVINKSAVNDINAEIDLGGFFPKDIATFWRFGKPEDTAGKDISEGKMDKFATKFRKTFPSYSMTVIALEPVAAKK